MSDSSDSSRPYGPATPAIRQFLVQLAGLGADSRAAIVARYHAAVTSIAWVRAERVLGDTIERAGRGDARDALAGPLLQLVRAPSTAEATAELSDDDLLASLDPVAEPALAALLSVLVRDVLPEDVFATLYAPFAAEINLRDAAATTPYPPAAPPRA